MGLDIWFAEDIRNALLAANEASAATLMAVFQALPTKGDDRVADCLRAYREGYKAALYTLALAFGIAPQAVFGGSPDGQDAEKEGRQIPEPCE